MAEFRSDIKIRGQFPIQNAPKTRVDLGQYWDKPQQVQQVQPSQPIQQPQQPKKESSGAFNWTMDQLKKPLASFSNAVEDTGKTLAYPIANAIKPGSFEDYSKKLGIDFLGHQADVWTGKNKRTFFTMTGDMAKNTDNKIEKVALGTIGLAGDFALDPLNKLKILGLTQKGLKAEKTGKLALSAAEQADKGQRALVQFGKMNILPSVGNRVISASTGINDAIRGTKAGQALFKAGSAISGKIRPAGVSREEFKILTDAKTAARDTLGYTQGKAIDFAKGLQKTLTKRKATNFERSQLLYAIEKGDEKLAPTALQDLWKVGVDFKNANETAWKALGGSVLEGHGLSHVATDAVAEQARKSAFKGEGGFKLTSTKTPQDIHRQWVKIGDEVVNLKDEGIKYVEDALEKGKGAYINKAGNFVQVKQATAMEVNNAMAKAGKEAIFQEDLPIVAARMGISTGRKQAATEFLEATKGLKGEEAKALANEVHNKMVNPESLRKAIQMFDSVQNIWKAQALLAPSYHIRNFAGNLWNNYLADVKTGAYVLAGKLQNNARKGTLTKVEKGLINEMKKNGIINTGQYGGDIAQTIKSGIGSTTLNPLSQNFAGYRANFWLGGGVEDNAKIAHYLSKRAEGYGVKQASESVKKYLFDYGDLTDVEKGLMKRIMPFYTWTSKNIPLQVQQFVENPGKFSKIAIAKKNIEEGVEQPDEKYMSDYVKDNAPIRVKTDENGNTMYFLAGAWLPAAQAMTFLSNPKQSALGMVSPMFKLPYENITGKGTFFQNTLGEYEDIQKYPGQKTSYLGLDMNPQTVNNLRSIRALNELNNLNPGEIFGGKNSPSIFQGMVPNASNVRGGKNTPDISQQDRALNAFFGKLQGYNPEQSQTYYDRDTQSKVNEYNTAINRALANNQTDLASSLIREMEQFVQERDGKPNKALQMYNLIGDQYFQDQARNKQAEKNRDDIRSEMKKKIRKAILNDDKELLSEAIKMDPTYAKQAFRDALKEKQESERTPEEQKMLYDFEQRKREKVLNSFNEY